MESNDQCIICDGYYNAMINVSYEMGTTML